MIPPAPLARLALRLPGKRVWLGRPVVSEGQTLDRTVQWLLALQRALDIPALEDRDVAVCRRNSAVTMRLFAPREPSVSSEPLSLPGGAGPRPARRYRPPGLAGPALPTLLYLHGGGWTVGDLDTHDGVCRRLARQAACQVISLDYRLAPEDPYPAAVDDAWAALEALRTDPTRYGADPDRLAIGGDSAGGTLSAVVSRRARDADLGAPCFQLLIYPATDATREAPSLETYAEGYLLTRDDVRFYKATYLPDPARRPEPDASPLLVEDLSGLAPAAVLTAGYDPLRDEGDAYARRLAEAGVPTHHDRFPDLVHGWLNMAGAIPAASRAFDETARLLRDALHG